MVWVVSFGIGYFKVAGLVARTTLIVSDRTPLRNAHLHSTASIRAQYYQPPPAGAPGDAVTGVTDLFPLAR